MNMHFNAGGRHGMAIHPSIMERRHNGTRPKGASLYKIDQFKDCVTKRNHNHN